MSKEAYLPYLGQVVELTQRPEPPESEILGYHGTSVQALGHAARTGYFPTTGAFGEEFYFVPVTIGRQDGEVVTHEEARESAYTWGEFNAKVRFMLENSKKETAQPAAEVERARKLWEAMYDAYLSQWGFGQEVVDALGLSEERARDVYDAMEAYEGESVLLTLSTSTLEEFPLHGGDGEDVPDNSIMTDGGLPLKCISRIELLGDHEREVLHSWRD